MGATSSEEDKEPPREKVLIPPRFYRNFVRNDQFTLDRFYSVFGSPTARRRGALSGIYFYGGVPLLSSHQRASCARGAGVPPVLNDFLESPFLSGSGDGLGASLRLTMPPDRKAGRFNPLPDVFKVGPSCCRGV